MGCCIGANGNMSKKIDILLNSEKIIKNDEFLNVNEQMTNVQIKKNIDKEEIKKEKSKLENNNLVIQQIQKDNNNKSKKESKMCISSNTQIVKQNISSNSKDKENLLKVNKKRAIKKGSENIYSAMRKLKLLSLEELDNKKTFFQ